ncbi:DMT family transporter [Sinomonas notoginsengisoli]|uniref:DMT family transporter n=1 Tax=Sinomonas notoginsengisoli TaxID=1457311 RepID=UPI001F26758D|nr:EamA family transporter [Sinomonas notoginsengisoli]
MNTAGRKDTQTVLVFVGALIVAGGNGVAIRYSNRELDPLFGAALRFAVAALIFALVMAAERKKWPRGRQLVGAFLYGLLNFGLAYGLIYEGLREVHAGLAQIVLASVPLATLLLAAGAGIEAFSWRRLTGTVVAIAGIAVMSGVGTTMLSASSLLGIVAIVAAAVSVGAGAVVVKVFPPTPGAALNAIGMGTGALTLAIASLASGEHWTAPTRSTTFGALGFLVVSTVILFAAFLFVLRRWSASATAYQFLFLPIPALILSSFLDGEPLTPGLFLGGLLVLGGSYLGMRPRTREGHSRGAVVRTVAHGK